MLLTTLRCAATRCPNEFSEEVPRWHLLLFARDAGWTSSDDEELFWCPEHGPESLAQDKWVVGCFTCGFEEEYRDEEEATYEHLNHECEADTWIWDPVKVKEREQRQQEHAREHGVKQAVARIRADVAAHEERTRQQRIEEYANRWLRIRNLFLFWKREHI